MPCRQYSGVCRLDHRTYPTLVRVPMSDGTRQKRNGTCLQKVISPGPAAGAYWLERRQSYRVKMSAPPPPGRASNSDSDAGRRKTPQQRPRRRPPQHDHSQHRPNVTALASTPLADNDRARPSAGKEAKYNGKTTATTARPMRATRTATAPATTRRGPPLGTKGGERSREERGN